MKLVFFQVLTRIFEFLQLEDRKSVRLTCKLWNESSRRVSIVKNEKIVFRTNCGVPQIYEMLVNSNFTPMCVEFQVLRCDYFPADIWEMTGAKIRALHFHNCLLKDLTLENIIVHCVNLESIDIYDSGEFYDTLFSFNALDRLIEKNIQRPKLHTFSMSFKCKSIRTDLFQKLLTVFPCIANFKAIMGSYSRRDFIEQSLSTCIQLKSLVFSTHGYSENVFWLRKPMIPVWQSRL